MEALSDTDTRLLVDSADRFFADKHGAILRGDYSDMQGSGALWSECAAMGWLQICESVTDSEPGFGTLEAAALMEAIGAYLPPLPLAHGVAIATLLVDIRIPAHEARPLASWLQGQSSMGMVEDDTVLYAAAEQALRLSWADNILLVEQVTPSRVGYGVDPLIAVAAEAGEPRRVATLPCEQPMWRRYRARLRCLLLAEALGAAGAALNLAVQYAKEREQFGRPIGANQAIKHALADNRMALDDARLALHDACAAIDGSGEAMANRLAMAELLVQEATHAIAAQSIQAHGATGFTWECPVHFYFKRIKHIGARLRRNRDAVAILEQIWEAC
ncbi:MAG: acyl-CoA dehydrogenase family protein [Burkholderiaceae bacterium]